jgi:hypothetical protein
MRRLWMILVGSLLVVGIALYAQDTQLDCPDGTSYENAVWLTLPPNVGSPLLPANAPADTPLPYVLTVLELQGEKPILAVQGENNFAACAPPDPRTHVYNANLPTTGEVPASPLSSGIIAPPQATSLALGLANATGDSSEFLLFIEGVSSVATDGAGDVYALPVTEGMIASGIPLTAYIVALDANHDVSLTVVDADGRDLRDANNQVIACDNAGEADTCYGESTALEGMFIAGFRNQRFEGKATDAMLTLPLDAALLETGIALRVNADETAGEYALILHFASGAPANMAVAATLEQDDAGTLTIACGDGSTLAEGVRFDLPALTSENTYRVTAIGSGDFNPGLAVFNADGSGTCFDNTPGAEVYTAILPVGNFTASDRTAQAVLPPDAAYVVVGTSSTPPIGSVAILIEGFAYATPEVTETLVAQLDITQQFATAQAAATQTFAVLESAMTQTAVVEQILLTQTAVAAQPEATLPPEALLDAPQILGDTFALRVSPGMADAEGTVFVYMFAAEPSLNPLLAWVDDNNTVFRDETARLVICDDAGIPPKCQENLPNLAGYNLTIVDNLIVPGVSTNAALRLPIGAEDAGKTLRVVAATPNNSGGTYVLAIVLNTR